MKSPIKIILVSFLFGLVVGGLSIRGINHWRFSRTMTPDQRLEFLVKRFGSKLNLTPDQKGKISAILKSSQEQMKSLSEEVQPKFEAIRNATADQVRKELSPEQLAKFNKMHENFEHHMKKNPAFPPFHA